MFLVLDASSFICKQNYFSLYLLLNRLFGRPVFEGDSRAEIIAANYACNDFASIATIRNELNDPNTKFSKNGKFK